MKRDLGTYHFKVEFEDGRGFIYRWDTGMRFTHGRSYSHPLNTAPIKPAWESEEDLFNTAEYMFTEGNYSCDCNKNLFLADAAQESSAWDHDNDCGDKIKLKRLTAIRPNSTEVVICTSLT